MKITKEAEMSTGSAAMSENMEKINRYTKKKLTEDQVFVFDILLCDNRIDRDMECFSTEALYKLRELFKGKTGIFDHQWSADGQRARIFDTQVIEEQNEKSDTGEPYRYLKASAYMLRTEKNAELIAEIEGGIKREVSIGCSVAKSVCSICGEEAGDPKCGHVKGREYNGKLCWMWLCEPTDAYEWSFVAVPSQKKAGVMKKFRNGGSRQSLAGLIESTGDMGYISEYREIVKKAEYGDTYLKALREETVRKGILADREYDKEFLEKITEKLGVEELAKMNESFEKRLCELYPPYVQLRNTTKDTKPQSCGEFLI